MTDPDAPLLEAAAAVLDEDGDLSMARVAARAGVARGTLYRRFGDKDGLLARLATTRGVSVDALATGTRERALDAVGEVLGRLGPAGLTIEAVARQAGLGEATVYRHFGDRASLLRAFGNERTPRRVAREMNLDGDPETELAHMATAALRFAARFPALMRLAFAGDPQSALLANEMRVNEGRARDRLHVFFAHHIDGGRLEGDAARLTAAFLGLVVGMSAHERAIEPDADGRFIARLLIRGVTPKENLP
ncbi:MAG: TetR/AcrR family transcriptional regulator [Myxococcales bacterium]|nr:TetR/AcrR family transcriptional regulator [Myxococcales bacterium]